MAAATPADAQVSRERQANPSTVRNIRLLDPAVVGPAYQQLQSLYAYYKFNDIEKEIADARVYGGMHFRHSAMNGAQLGRTVARNMRKNFFQKLQ